ncbi:MAG: NAD-dependent DNA ligase LigA, partial [Polyangiaceae bacterium]|nr:NAD-dependent DNA ligase LigA [Polyangiaceae bacterium]
ITQNAIRIKHLPTKIGLKGPLEIRGEIYMLLSVFAKYKAEGMANPRNLTAGAIKQKDPEKSGAYGLSFAAYGVLGGPVERREIESFSGELDALREAGFTRIDYVKLSQEEAPEGYARFAKERTTLDYEIDGVVYKVDAHREQERLGQTSHHPRYALAYKFQGDAGVTTLREVEWSVARTGAITPVALVEPVALSGVTVSRASLHNVSFIDKLGLTLGAKVTLVRRGGVIPNVEHVVEAGPQPVAIPSVCPSCGAAVVRERDFIYCSSPSTCRSAVIGQLAHFASVLDMLGFGEALLEQSYDAGILRSFADFYRLQADQLLKLERAGEKLAKKLLGEVEKKRSLDLATFLRALGINELGKNVSEILATRYQTLERVRAASVAELAAEHSIGETIATSVVEGLQRSSDAIDDLLKYVKFEARALSGGESGPLAGKSFVFTGKMVAFARNEGEKRVRNAGGSVLSSVTKALDYLVIGADKEGGKSTKEKAADKLVAEGGKLKILSEDEFLQMVAS